MKTTTIVRLAGAACVVTLTGCASDEINPAIDRAAVAVQRAEQDNQVPQAGPDALERARESLERARMLQEERPGDEVSFRHEAYLASRYAEVAIARADAARAREQVESAEIERARVLLEARAAEARAAEREARQRAAEAQRAVRLAEQRGEQAQAAQAEAQRLERQLQELQAERTERGLVLTLGDVLFETDEAELMPGARDTVDRLAEFLDEYPERQVIIEGHTDSRGTEEYNRMLAQQRANAVRDALLARDIPIERTRTRSLGESEPVASNDTAAGRQENRRVEVIISNENGRFESADDEAGRTAAAGSRESARTAADRR